MDKTMFKREAVFLDIEGNSTDDILNFVYEEMYAKGYVTKEFQEAVKERERVYPTGLPGGACDIAVPHTDPDYVIKPFIAVVRTTEKIPFMQMGTRDLRLAVRLVFVLGFKADGYQVAVLRTLIEALIEDGTITPHLLNAASPDEMYKLLEGIEGATAKYVS